jgi:galactokinase
VRAENEVVGASTGGLDQAASLRCTAGHALLLDCRDGGVRQVPLDLETPGLSFLVIDTRAEHSHADGEYSQRRSGSEEAARRLGVETLREVVDEPLDDTLGRLPDELRPLVRHVVTEIQRVQQTVTLLEAGRVSELGPVMAASHASMRDDYRISAEELDVAVEVAAAAGALGARMTGGGFGGSAVALVPTAEVESVARSVDRAFRDAGWRPPAFLLAEPSASGHRVL